MPYFIDAILPIPVEKAFTYSITEAEAKFLQAGMRVAVPFGKSKVYAALVKNIHTTPPTLYEAKEIEHILDETPIVTQKQFELWTWMASYYMCTEGEVMRASLPSAFLLESETIIRLQPEILLQDEDLQDDEFLIYEALQHQSVIKIQEVMNILGKRKVLPTIKKLLDKGAISVQEEVYEQYKPKLVTFVQIHADYKDEVAFNELIDALSRAPKQRELLLTFFSLKAKTNKPISTIALQKAANATASQLKALVTKGVFETYKKRKDRIAFEGETSATKTLNTHQQVALSEIQECFETQNVCLLHGVTASGKTEIYVSLIEKLLHTGKQILYLLPEIALTTQLIARLQNYFGEKVAVFHSKYSVHERVEVWNNVLKNASKAQIIIGARSAMLLPFHDLEFIVVDEEQN